MTEKIPQPDIRKKTWAEALREINDKAELERNSGQKSQ
jgi:hypothetical protein